MSDADCDDGNMCTNDVCNSTTYTCQHQNTDGNACDDGSACTVNDTCTQGQCVGQATTCDDGNPCTVDSCNPSDGSCTFTPSNE